MTQAGRKVFVLFKNGKYIKVWTSLTKLHKAMTEKGKFISYSKLVKDVNAERDKSESSRLDIIFKTKVEAEINLEYDQYLLIVEELD